MIDKDFVLTTMREYGMRRAQDLQETSEGMTGTELYEKEDYIPDFSAAVAKKNMLERKAGKTDGFLCRSSAGRIVRLIQNYNSDTYPQEPEELPALWSICHTKDPSKAKEWLAPNGTSGMYMSGECCVDGGVVYRCLADNTVHSPTDYPQAWERV